MRYLEMMLDCEKELERRRWVYPQLIREEKITKAVADQEIEAMKHMVDHFKRLSMVSMQNDLESPLNKRCPLCGISEKG